MINKELFRYIIGILIFSLYPFLAFFANNTTELLDLSVLIYAWAIFTVAMLCIVSTLCLTIKKQDLLRKIINVQLISIFIFFIYGVIFTLAKNIEFLTRTYHYLIVWGVVLLLSVIGIWVFSKKQDSTKYLTIFVSAMMIVPVLNIGVFIYSYATLKSDDIETINNQLEIVSDKEMPNVYHFLFDGYGRDDHLLKEIGFDSTVFIGEIQELGFEVVKKANANYMYTYPSVATMKNMEYLVVPNDDSYTSFFRQLSSWFTDKQDNNPSTAELENRAMRIMTGQNNSSRMFKSLGYTTVQTARGTADCPPSAQDICVGLKRSNFLLSDTAWGLLNTTPFGIIFQRLFTKQIDYSQSGGRSFLDHHVPKLITLVRNSKNPIAIFSHILLPHRPFVDESCELIPQKNYKFPRDDKKEILGLNSTLYCLQNQIRQYMKEILEFDPGAIIVLSSDHGFANVSFWDNKIENMSEQGKANRFGIFLAVKSPKLCKKWIHQTMSPVNINIFISSCIRKKTPEYYPDKSYLFSHENHESNRHAPVDIMLWKE
jgi:hypothetical protein